MKSLSLRVPVQYVDPLNIVLIFATCGLAHLFPYHLLVFSYAVLGPAHYLTQISWLHDRKYFASSAAVMPILTAFSLLLVILFFVPNSHDGLYAAVTLGLALGTALIFIVPPKENFRIMAVVATAIMLLLITFSPKTALIIALLLPTVLHVFVFTAAFMWAGAMRSGKTVAYWSVIILVLCAATFLTRARDVSPHLAGILFFKPVVALLKDMLSISNATETQLFGFLSFAYTYHYLNWFSKVEVIRWDRIPKQRMYAIVLIYIAAIGIYAISYTLGFLILLFLADLHVLLEFPLNMRTFATIAGSKAPR